MESRYGNKLNKIPKKRRRTTTPITLTVECLFVKNLTFVKWLYKVPFSTVIVDNPWVTCNNTLNESALDPKVPRRCTMFFKAKSIKKRKYLIAKRKYSEVI